MSSQQADVRWANPIEVKKWVEAGEALVIDVREVDEFAQGHIPGAINNPLSSFDPAKVPAADDKKLVFHCKGGVRCGPASQKYVAAGYSGTLYRLEGGIMAYQQFRGTLVR